MKTSPLTEMLFSLKVAKKYMHVYYFHGKHFTCWDLHGMLETDNFGYKESKDFKQFIRHAQALPN